MPHKVYNPLVIQHQQCIYVLGRNNKGTVPSASQYNIEDDTWNNGATCHQLVVTKLMSLLSKRTNMVDVAERGHILVQYDDAYVAWKTKHEKIDTDTY